ncbi:MAG: hypothetical protein ACKVJ9_09535 [Cytophagales bacterium]
MSSHHFVKENQEPALIIDHLTAFPFSKLEDLLEWAPQVICLSDAVPEALMYQFKIDVIMGIDLDVSTYTDFQDHIECISLTGNLWEGVISYLNKLKVPGAYFITDQAHAHQLINQMKPYAPYFDLQVISPEQRYILSRKKLWKKWISGSGRYTAASFDPSQRLTATLFGKPISHHDPLETLDILYEGEGFIEIKATECPYLISEPL